jgi:hypothetical protein
MVRRGIGLSGLATCKTTSYDMEVRIMLIVPRAIAVPAVVVSTNDVISIENSLNSLFDIQNQTNGLLPYAGRPFFSAVSFTYHLYTLIGVADHYLYTVRPFHLLSSLPLILKFRETCPTSPPSGLNTNSPSPSLSPPSTPPA